MKMIIKMIIVNLLGILCITLCHLGYPVTSWLVLVTMAALAFGDEHV